MDFPGLIDITLRNIHNVFVVMIWRGDKMAGILKDEFRIRENIPTTISRQAQAYLQGTRVADLDPSRPDWPEVVKATYKLYAQLNTELKVKYVQNLDELSIAGVPVSVITPRNYDKANDARAICYMHGGAYVLFNPQNTYGTWAPLACASGLKIYAVDYRLAPQYPYPAAPDDCFQVYREMIKQYAPESLGIFGDSAGGALALVTALRAHKEGMPLPAALALFSPATDVTKTGDTYYTNEGLDIVIHYERNLLKPIEAYTVGHDPRDPQISPIYADFPPGLPPTMILSGTRDLLLSCCVRLYRAMKKAGNTVELNLWEGMWHDHIGFPDMPETDEAFTDMAAFFRLHLK